MAIETIEDLQQFVRSLGGLHDVEVDNVLIDVGKETLKLVTPDINANFTNPGVRDCRPATLIFHGVTSFQIDVDMEKDGVRITDVRVFGGPAIQRFDIDLNLGGGNLSGGRRSLTIYFKSLQVRYDEPNPSS